MNKIEHYNKARLEIESRFTGLPHAHTTLIKSLITRADPATGIVENLSCRDLAMLLMVEHAPGRKGAGTPQIQTIRSYLRTISENCSDDFRVISQGQKLKCQFINLPKIYAHFCAPKESYGDSEEGLLFCNPFENTEQMASKSQAIIVEETTECPIGQIKNTPVKNINNITNKHNKQTPAGIVSNLKQPISEDFYPNQETINTALSRGFTRVICLEEIQKFIQHNIDKNTQWADFNPVFLWWLQRDDEYRKTQQQSINSQKIIRNHRHERSSYQSNSFEAVMARVLRDNQDALAPSESYARSQAFNTFDHTEHGMALATDDGHLRVALL